MMNRWLSLLLSLLILPALAQERDANQESTPMIHLNVEQLPDLNIPRAGHQVFCANGEFVVAGGHTDGSLPATGIITTASNSSTVRNTLHISKMWSKSVPDHSFSAQPKTTPSSSAAMASRVTRSAAA